jgi:hypothetical protein
MAVWESEANRQETQLIIEHSRRRTVGRRPITHDYGFTGV